MQLIKVAEGRCGIILQSNGNKKLLTCPRKPSSHFLSNLTDPIFYLSKGAINVFASCHDDCLQALLELIDAG